MPPTPLTRFHDSSLDLIALARQHLPGSADPVLLGASLRRIVLALSDVPDVVFAQLGELLAQHHEAIRGRQLEPLLAAADSAGPASRYRAEIAALVRTIRCMPEAKYAAAWGYLTAMLDAYLDHHA